MSRPPDGSPKKTVTVNDTPLRIQTILDRMAGSPGDVGAQVDGCWALAREACTADFTADDTTAALTAVLSATRSFARNLALHQIACALLRLLASRTDFPGVADLKASSAVLSSMQAFQGNVVLQQVGCTALGTFAAAGCLTEATEQPAVDAVMRALTNHAADRSTCSAAFEALLALGANPTNVQAMLHAGAPALIRQVLHRHRDLPDLRSLGDKALTLLTGIPPRAPYRCIIA